VPNGEVIASAYPTRVPRLMIVTTKKRNSTRKKTEKSRKNKDVYQTVDK
jgi:hypothetical protein